jgi:hypothetical protein
MLSSSEPPPSKPGPGRRTTHKGTQPANGTPPEVRNYAGRTGGVRQRRGGAVFGILAIICIILGFATGLFDADVKMETVAWFAAAIAFNTLGAKFPKFKRV